MNTMDDLIFMLALLGIVMGLGGAWVYWQAKQAAKAWDFESYKGLFSQPIRRSKEYVNIERGLKLQAMERRRERNMIAMRTLRRNGSVKPVESIKPRRF